MSEDIRYRQLALFSVIIGQVVLIPSLLGGLAYWLLRTSSFQTLGTVGGAILGLCLAFYRISLIKKTLDENNGSDTK
jgi:uncharacterized Tic20 family protein